MLPNEKENQIKLRCSLICVPHKKVSPLLQMPARVLIKVKWRVLSGVTAVWEEPPRVERRFVVRPTSSRWLILGIL